MVGSIRLSVDFISFMKGNYNADHELVGIFVKCCIFHAKINWKRKAPKARDIRYSIIITIIIIIAQFY